MPEFKLIQKESLDLNLQDLENPQSGLNDMKKGTTRFHLNDDEEIQYLSYVPIRDELVNWEELKLKENFAVKNYKDSVYRGQILKAKRHGKGIITYNSQRVYEGEWLNDKRDGMGYERFTNGNQYEGQYKNGKVEGLGRYTWVNNEYYDGQWIAGNKQGHGTWQGSQNEQYSGQWHSNQPNGFGKHVWGNGDIYEGEWKACLRHGQGSDKFSVGDSYVGEYLYGKAEGYGQYSWSNGNVYLGQFVNGMKNGQGMWKKNDKENSNQYEGRYKNDKKHGYGEFQWSTGSKYKGNYVQDIKKGYGEMFWSDGTIYRGYWDQGQQNGAGIMIFKDGMRKAGFFKENIFQQPLTSLKDLEDYAKESKIKIPETFRQEIKEYIGFISPNEDNSQFIGKQFNPLEPEDFTKTNQLMNMQEMGLAPFGPAYGLSKEDYAKQVAEIEEAEKKHHNEQEPEQLQETPDEIRRQRIQIEEEQKRKLRESQIPKRIIFHDFDYINPLTMLPEGETSLAITNRNTTLQLQSTKKIQINNKFHGQPNSPVKSLFVASEMESEQQKQSHTRLGGYRSPLRALKNIKPHQKSQISPGLKQQLQQRFSSLNIKTIQNSYRNGNSLPYITQVKREVNNGSMILKSVNRYKQNNKILQPLIHKKQLRPWIPSGNKGQVYGGKVSLEFKRTEQNLNQI